MRLAQASLERNFATFMTRLRSGAQGLPNIHVAVISQDMGAGDGSIDSCNSTGGKNGIFQYTARGSCAATNLQAGATYISDIAGQRNYTGNLEDVFTCIAALGEGGCGYEHQFAAILRALGADGRLPPAENQGFLRPEATLGIIMITNEDDCSATPGILLHDTDANTNLASQFGPPTNFRCNEFGHICDSGTSTGIHPSRNAPGNNVSATVNYTNCRSNDSEGYLLGAVDTANRLKALKPNASQVLVAAITGPPTPYTVTWRAPFSSDTTCGAASCPWPAMAHSCTAADTSFADPPVRICRSPRPVRQQRPALLDLRRHRRRAAVHRRQDHRPDDDLITVDAVVRVVEVVGAELGQRDLLARVAVGGDRELLPAIAALPDQQLGRARALVGAPFELRLAQQNVVPRQADRAHAPSPSFATIR